MRGVLAIAALSLAACSSAPEQKAAAPKPPPVADDTGRLLTANRTSARVVPDHVLGIGALPGGTVGDYETKKGQPYQLFIIETPSAQDAAIMLLDLKGALQTPKYIPWMGGYSGTNAGKPIFAFAKTKYLAGVAGLPEDAADPIARELAVRLN